MIIRIAKWVAVAGVGMVACWSSSATAAAAPFGIYAYNPATWNSDVAGRFPIVFVQYNSWNKSNKKIQEIRDLSANGSRVIVDFEFQRTHRQRTDREPMPAFRDVVDDANFFLKALNGVALEGITLDEENSASAAHLKFLSDLYEELKKDYPDRRFLQWVSVSKTANLQRANLRDVPADGWVMDPYLLPANQYAAYVREMRSFADRIYSIVWAAPNWQVDAGFRKKVGGTWWNNLQWKVFYNRLAVNQANDIPSIFYLYALSAKQAIGPWGGESCDRSFYSKLSTSLIPYINEHRLPLKVPATKPHWMPTYC